MKKDEKKVNLLKEFFMPTKLKIFFTLLLVFLYFLVSNFCSPIYFEGGETFYICGSTVMFLLSFLSIFPLISLILTYVLSCLIILVYIRFGRNKNIRKKDKKDSFMFITMVCFMLFIFLILMFSINVYHATISISLEKNGEVPGCAYWVLYNSTNIEVESREHARELLSDVGLIGTSITIKLFKKEQLNVDNNTIYGFGTSGDFVSETGDIYYLNRDRCTG